MASSKNDEKMMPNSLNYEKLRIFSYQTLEKFYLSKREQVKAFENVHLPNFFARTFFYHGCSASVKDVDLTDSQSALINSTLAYLCRP